VALFCLVVPSVPGVAQETCGPLAPGYHLREVDTTIALPRTLLDTATAFHVRVKRTFDNEDEERLLRVAEGTYPPRAAVTARLKLRAQWTDPDSTRRSLWWQAAFDGVRIPYAITADAARYYLELSKAYVRGDHAAVSTIPMQRTDFVYIASIRRAPIFDINGWVFEDVYVVRMRLTWSNHCGSLCALGFSKERTVVLTREARVLAVFGDGPTPTMVS